ncbi:MAG: prepilin-type N-terminal cleavage/methylation domain-containing protein [Zoogloeaceae bacterium]|jgi:prepilin-type N-terminal cleavage/methylation domain-containing protein|nr:prepilin-type N-terminal cleavage/methylation domain-containing protein [Zoogloeaceae bacterium]
MLREYGFTLLEVMVVLFISGLMIALTGPRFSTYLDAYRQQYALREIENGLLQLPRRVRLSGQALELPRDLGDTDLEDGAPPLVLPEGWQLTATPPLKISALGVCSGSRIVVQTPVVAETGLPSSTAYDIEALTCDLSAGKDHGA